MKQAFVLLSVWLSLACVSVLSHAEDEDFLSVDKAFSYYASLDNSKLQIHFDIADHYYLYLSRLSITQKGQALAFNFVQPPIDKEDEYFGQVKVFKHQLDITAELTDTSPIQLNFQGCAEAGLCYPPQKRTIDTNKINSRLTALPTPIHVNSENTGSIIALLQSGNLIWQMLIFFALGVGLSFTPCVFPMIPILSSIIVGQGASITTRKAFIMSLTYVLAMAIAYASAGVIVGYFGAKANIQLYLQSPWILGTFAFVFVLLSLSMFGFYELQLPRIIQDKLNNWNQKQQGGHLVSVAIMGILSALVVSPCVSAPLAGTLVYISTTGDALLGGAALLALGLGMGLPLILIGTGGSKFLPKAGGWMNAVKSVFGVALLGVAIWLLERIIPASVTMMLWATLLITSGVFLGAFEQHTKSWQRLFKSLGLIMALYGTLMVIGVASGQSSPLQPLANVQPLLSHNLPRSEPNNTLKPINRITKSDEFKILLKKANDNNQIAILDFYADWCIACKIMENEIFHDTSVQQQMANTLFIQLDMTNNTNDQLELLNSFGLFGPPAVLFFKNSQELTALRIMGEVDKSSFEKQLASALSL